jgi:peptidoglycan hydrolase CwlO-like protein
METLTFIHGIFTVIGILMAVGIVWVLFKVENLVDELTGIQDQLNYLERRIDDVDEESLRHTDTEMKEIYKQIDDIYRKTDSRFDKFENRINQKQLLND